MDHGGQALNLVLGVFVGAIIGLIVVSLYRLAHQRKASPKYLAVLEYWVFLPGEALPNQDQVMTLMVARNPYAQGGQSPIGPREGLLFSDIRLSCTLVLRAKNPHVFRPDLFADVHTTPEVLTGLSSAQSLVKLRYLSEEPLRDKRHLQFLPHLADAYARLGGGLAVYDVVAERLYQVPEFQSALGEHVDATRPEFHVRTLWVREEGRPRAETKGMMKLGLPELVTAEARPDQERLVVEVLGQAAFQAFTRGELENPEVVEFFGDRFEVTFGPARDRLCQAHIVRYQPV